MINFGSNHALLASHLWHEKEVRIKQLNYLGVALLYDYKTILQDTILQIM